jgi:hypothetical protein
MADWKPEREKKGQFATYHRQARTGPGSLGAAALCLPLPACARLIPLMAEGSNGLLPYLDIPFQHAHPDTLKRMAPPRGGRTHARRDPRLARDLSRHRPALDLHRRLPRRDRGGVPDAARLAGRGATRPGRMFQIRERGRRAVERLARSRARRGQGRALAALHGQGAGDLRGEARRQGRSAHAGDRRRGRR